MTTDNKPRKGQTMSQKPMNKMTKAELIKALDEAEARAASLDNDLERRVQELFTDQVTQRINRQVQDEVRVKLNKHARQMLSYVYNDGREAGIMEGHERGYAWGFADGIADTCQGYEAHHMLWNTERILLRDGHTSGKLPRDLLEYDEPWSRSEHAG